MKEDEDIETMFSRFKVLVYGLKFMKKIYTTYNHVKNILRSLHVRYRPKARTILEAKGLNTISLESLITNLQSHEMELNGDEPVKKSKSLALKYVSQPSTSSKI